MSLPSPKRSFDSFDNLYASMEKSAGLNARDEIQTPDVKPNEDYGEPSWKSLFSFTTKRQIPNLCSAGFFTICSSLEKPITAALFGKIFSLWTQFGAGTLGGFETLHQTSKWCMALALLGSAAWVIEGMFYSQWLIFGEIHAKKVRQILFSRLLEKDMDWYDKRQDGIGALMIRIQTQIRELQLSLSQPLAYVAYDGGVIMLSFGVAFYYSWQLTLVILATLPVLSVVIFLVSRNLAPAIESQKRHLTTAAKHTTTAIANISTVKAYNGEDQEIWQYYQTVKRVAASYLLQAKVNALQFAILKLATVALFIQGFGFGLYLVNRGVDPGRVYTTFYACLISLQSFEFILAQFLVIKKGISAGHTLKAMISELQKGREIKSMLGAAKPSICEGDIEIKNVSFSYPSNLQQEIMSQVNFFFPAHETTFMVGKSGSGKSTIGNLLMKYYEATQGEILIDGQSIQTIDVDWLRQNITLVQQQSVLFNETILQNIAFGRTDPSTRVEIMGAAQTADLEQTLMDLPKGINTLVGIGGASLSGGQQQRVALARARLRDSPIVILDEATSALDQKSRVKVMDRIREWRKGKTTIIITHEVSQIQDDEYVYVLENGKVVQEGYCKNLAEKEHGKFSSFLTPKSSASPTSGDARMDSDPLSPLIASPVTGLPDVEDVKPNVSRFSRILGVKLSDQQRYSRNSGIFEGAVGISAPSTNVVRAVERWATPEMPSKPGFQSFEPSRTQQAPALDFSSPTESYSIFPPQSVPRPEASTSASPQLDPRSSFRTLPPAHLNTNFKVSQHVSRPRLVPIASVKRTSTYGPLSPDSNGNLNWSAPAYDDKDSRRWPLSLDTSVKVVSKRGEPKSEEPPQEKQRLNREGAAESQKLEAREASSIMQIFRTIWPIISQKDRAILIFGFIAAFIVAVATPAFAVILGQLIGVYYAPADRAALGLKWCLILLGVAIFDAFATFCSHLCLEYAAQQWVNGLRIEALKRILAQPRSWFDTEKNSADRLSECLDRNAEEMRNLIGRFAGPAFTTFWMLSTSIVWSLIISWKLTLVAIACMPVGYLNTRIFNWVSSRWEDKCNQAADFASSVFTETFSNIRVVRALTLETHFKLKHDRAIDNGFRVGLRRCIYSSISFGFIDVLSVVTITTILYYATFMTTHGQLSVTGALQVANLLVMGIANTVGVLNMIPQINSSRTTGTQMLYLAQLPKRSSHETTSDTRVPTPFPVVFNNLSFKYPNKTIGRKTLSNINLTIENGTCTALVGPSGSGKSTIASLLLGLYPPSNPASSPHPLTFNNVSISDLNTTSLRNYMSIVAQKPLLFPSSVYENIIYGLPENSPYRNLDAAKQAAVDAGIHDFVMGLASGYGTVIGEGGMGISGGQAQRVAIARALVRKPKILILDEATSALDKISADAVRDAISNVIERGRHSRTEDATAVVIITHDIEMMKIAERIVVLEQGEIKEVGGFNELRRKRQALGRLLGDVVDEVEEVGIPLVPRTRDSWVRRDDFGMGKGSI